MNPGPQVPEPIKEDSSAALGVLGGAGERGAFVPPTEYVMRGGTAIQASGGEFSPSEARDLAHVVLEAMPELFDRAALAGGPDGKDEDYGVRGAAPQGSDVDARPEIRLRLVEGGWRFTARTVVGHDMEGWHPHLAGAALQAAHCLDANPEQPVSVVREGDRQEPPKEKCKCGYTMRQCGPERCRINPDTARAD